MIIKPCPFCGGELEEAPAFASRNAKHFIHPRNDETPCVIDGIRVIVSDRPDDKQRLDAWNRRT